MNRVREYPLNVSRILKIFHAKLKYDIVTYNLNVYKTSIKQTSISLWLSTTRNINFENQALQILKRRPVILLYYKKLKALKNLRPNFSYFLTENYKTVTTGEYCIEKRRGVPLI